MKKFVQELLILTIVLFTSAQMTSAQKSDTASTQRYNLYMQRHKTFNTVGWVLVVPGAIMVAGGMVSLSNNGIFSDSANTSAAFASIGTLMMLGSIPCFILSGSNARKAALELKTSMVQGPRGVNYALVGIKFSFK